MKATLNRKVNMPTTMPKVWPTEEAVAAVARARASSAAPIKNRLDGIAMIVDAPKPLLPVPGGGDP
jgi:hypothetical protein